MLCAFFVIGLAGFVPAAWAVSNTVVISQVYGAGGNSGSTLNQDYVELFNAGTTPVSLNGWSLQYRSAASTATVSSTEVTPLPNVTMQPGTFLLFGASTPGNGSSVAVDYTLNPVLNLAGGAGQVALSNSTTALTGACPASGNAAVVDFVGFGSTATCYEGSAPTGTLAATTAAIRKNVCTDTDNNGADFMVATAAPRNSSTTPQPCGAGTQTFGISGVSASPTTVGIGSQTLLTARITPGTSSSNIKVTVDLSGVGGSATQPLFDDGQHGDGAAGDHVFGYNATIGGTTTGNVTLNFKATDDQLESATASTVLAIQPSSAVIAIHTIQAGAPSSAYLGQMVTTTGIVTAIRTTGFYLEARDNAQDADATTSEGIFVVTGSSPSVVVGNELTVTGTVKVSSASAATPATEIAGTVTVQVVSTGNALPTPVTITAANDSPAGGFGQFLKYQSMRFTVGSFVTTNPTGGTLTETTETVVSNGEFYGVVSGVARPFVEPGISVLETTLPSGPTYCTGTGTGAGTTNCVPRFDGNPELMLVESLGLGGTALNVTSNQTITNMLGIVDFTTNGAEFLLDATAPGTLGTPMTFIPVPVAAANEFTVGSMNIERFYSNLPATGAVTITADAYQRRLAKISLLLRNVQRMPDIIGMQEVGTLATLNDISAKISTDALAAGQPDPKYATCLFQGNDTSGINTAFLVKTTRVTVNDCTQFGKATTFTNSTGASAELNDRPPLVLHATINATGYAPFAVTVISNHLRSLNGEDDTSSTGQTVRLKREYQAEFLANLIQGYQANGERVVSVGDYNAFPFSDGYSDSLGVIKGTPTPSSQVVNGVSSAYVAPNPVLTDLDTLITDPTARYDYTFIGNAQVLDHVVVTQNLLSGVHLAYSHEDADFPLIQYNDATTPQSASDHDGAVAFFPLLVPAKSAALTPATQDFGSVAIGSSSAAIPFTLSNGGTTAITVSSITATGDFTQTNNCGTSVAGSGSCTVMVTFTPTATGGRTGTLTAATSANNGVALTSALTGTAQAAPAVVTMTPATAAFGNVAVGTTSTAQVFTLSNTGGSSATITSIAVPTNFAQTNTCGTSLAAGAKCTVSVTFSPVVLLSSTGTLTVVTSASATALTASLTGMGSAQATLTPAAATFAATAIGKSSAAQMFAVSNVSGTAITFGTGAIAVSGDYTQTNNCGTSLASGASCSVSVVFAPTASGTRTGTLTVMTTITNVTTVLTSGLTGTGQVAADFMFTTTAQSGTVIAGNTATFALTLAGQGGFAGTVSIACTGAPTNSTCTPGASTVTVGASPVVVNVSISTRLTTSGAGYTSMVPAGLVSLVVLGLCFMRRRGTVRMVGLLSVLLAVSLYATGCGGGAKTVTPTVATVTPGTYTYTVTATSGTTTHAATYALTVQ